MAPEPEPNNIDDQVAQRLRSYRKAWEEEYKTTSILDESSKLTDLYPKAISTIEWLLDHAESDTARFNAAKYVIDRKLGPIAKVQINDEMQELLKELQS